MKQCLPRVVSVSVLSSCPCCLARAPTISQLYHSRASKRCSLPSVLALPFLCTQLPELASYSRDPSVLTLF